jgi:hypothetical protein
VRRLAASWERCGIWRGSGLTSESLISICAVGELWVKVVLIADDVLERGEIRGLQSSWKTVENRTSEGICILIILGTALILKWNK